MPSPVIVFVVLLIFNLLFLLSLSSCACFTHFLIIIFSCLACVPSSFLLIGLCAPPDVLSTSLHTSKMRLSLVVITAYSLCKTIRLTSTFVSFPLFTFLTNHCNTKTILFSYVFLSIMCLSYYFSYVLTLITDKEKHVIFGQPSIYEDPDPEASLGLYNGGVAYSSKGG